MAPERFSEQPYDGRADVYSLGVMLYEMLTGKPPFISPTGNPIKLALMHMSQPPRPLCEQNPELPSPLEKVVLSALAKDFTRRPSAAKLARQFVGALGLELPAPIEAAFDKSQN
jgi:serine/threonine protein kinase